MVAIMRKPLRILILLAVLAAIGGGAWWYMHRPRSDGDLTLYGNVDFRQASLAFNGSERIAGVLVEEGDIVKKGQVLARLDTSRLAPQVREADATVASQRAMVLKLRNGSRPEEIAQARANLASAKADAANANIQLERRSVLTANSTISKQELDTTKAAAEMADAKVQMAQSSLELAIAGPRAEELLQAEAQLRGSEAQLELMRQQLADAELACALRCGRPLAADGARRNGGADEAGVFTGNHRNEMGPRLCLRNQSRPYPPGHARQGDDRQLPRPSARRLDRLHFAHCGVHARRLSRPTDLRTSLVYEVRVFVEDPDDVLRLGMPSTVTLLPDAEPKPLAQNRQECGRQGKAMTTATPVAARSIHKSFRRDTGEIVKALDGVSFEAKTRDLDRAGRP